MSLRLKFNLILIVIFLVSLVSAAIYYNGYLEKSAINEVRNNSTVLMETALAIRSYTTDEIQPHLSPMNEKRFYRQTVPAFAATETLRRLRDKFPAYEYKEAMLNPTNPRDRATDWEAELIEKFRANPSQTELTGFHGEGAQRSMYVAHPIVVKQPQCLVCHSSPSAAPATMVAVYGDKNGFDWKMNEPLGMQIVKLPMLYPLEKARETFNSFLISLLITFALMFIALNVALSGLVIEPMARMNKKLEELATKDFLTDLVNRRRFFEQLESAMAEARVKKIGLSVVMLDIDFFKRINDTFGHDSGDVVLKNTALRVRELLRSSDCAARFGGEEFVLMLRETRIDAAMAIAEAVRGKIANVPFDLVGTVSASFGVAEWGHAEDGRALINRADRALYIAKQSGRNRVVRAEEA
ncbi:MAG: diguanylate cyclase [Casimicrobium sp.]